MAHDDYLRVTVEATLASLDERCESLFTSDVREVHARADAFVAATGRHLGAVAEVLLPMTARHPPAQGEPLPSYLDAARHLERVLVELKGKTYGEQHTAHLPWAQVRADVRGALDRYHLAERGLVDRVSASLPADALGEVAASLFHAEVKAPTRPHPYLPHSGRAGHLARRFAAVADHFWDAAQARIIPGPVVPPHKRHDSLVAQYMCADPHFDVTATLLEHHRLPGQPAVERGRSG
ncbi:MAG: hypothetical protein ACXVXB_10680 [Nocardioidaceae bacterium]